MSSVLFPKWSKVVHVKTGKVYKIGMVPEENYRLEACDEPFYAYYAETLPVSDRVYWFRRRSEMEDGRFKAHSST